MFERFTDRARKTMAIANQVAQSCSHEYISPSHIALAMLKDTSSCAAGILRRHGVVLESLAKDIRDRMVNGPEMVVMGNLPKSTDAKRVIECAVAAAKELGCNHVGTEHLLMGLIDGSGVINVVMHSHGVTKESVLKWYKVVFPPDGGLAEAVRTAVVRSLLDRTITAAIVKAVEERLEADAAKTAPPASPAQPQVEEKICDCGFSMREFDDADESGWTCENCGLKSIRIKLKRKEPPMVVQPPLPELNQARTDGWYIVENDKYGRTAFGYGLVARESIHGRVCVDGRCHEVMFNDFLVAIAEADRRRK